MKFELVSKNLQVDYLVDYTLEEIELIAKFLTARFLTHPNFAQQKVLKVRLLFVFQRKDTNFHQKIETICSTADLLQSINIFER